MSKPKTIEKSGGKKSSNIGTSKLQSSERQIIGNKELKSKNVTVDVAVEEVTARVATVSKEIMSCSVSKATNKKGNMFKNNKEAIEAEVIVCANSGYDVSVGYLVILEHQNCNRQNDKS